MKHLFCVHSNYTFLSAISVINKRELKTEDIIFLTFRDFEIPLKEFKSIELKQSWERKDVNYFVYLKSSIIWFLWYLYNFGLKKYEAYVPSSNAYSCFLLSNISQIKKYNYLDDGMLSYREINEPYGNVRRKTNLIVFLIMLVAGIRKGPKHYLKDTDTIFLLFDGFNKNLKNVEITKFPFLKLNKTEINKDSYILVIDDIFRSNPLNESDFINIFEQVNNKLIKLNFSKNIFYKLHPSYNYDLNLKERLNEHINVIFKEFDCNELDSNFILESEILNKNAKFIIGLSTVGFVCYKNDVEFLSYINMYSNKNRNYPIDYVNFLSKNSL